MMAWKLAKTEKENWIVLANLRHLDVSMVEITKVALICCCFSKLHVDLVVVLCLTRYFSKSKENYQVNGICITPW